MDRQPDPIEGQEVQMLNTMLAQVYPLAKTGDGPSIDRAIKILALKRQIRRDRRIEEIN